VAFFVSIAAIVLIVLVELAPFIMTSRLMGEASIRRVLAPAVVAYALAAWAQRGRFELAGKMLLVVTSVFQVTAITLLVGVEPQVHLFLLLPLIASALIFSSSQRLWRAASIVLSAIAFVALEFGFAYLGLERILPANPPSVAGAFLMLDVTLVAVVLCVVVLFFAREVESHERALEREQARNLEILENVLPARIARRLKDGETKVAERHAEVTVLFADLVGFTAFSRGVAAERLVEMLDELFRAFDDLADATGAEKIKTIGDAYMLVVGLDGRTDHARVAVEVGLRMKDALATWNEANGTGLDLRVGVHSGGLVAGVIGRRRFAFDLWGDTVNTAARMEAAGEPGIVVVSAATASRLTGEFVLEERALRDVKGLGETQSWRVVGASPPRS
jgi:guanylate cyclase